MLSYRVYLSKNDGRPPAVRELECATEADAFQSAARLIDGHPAVEVWRGPVCVGALTPADCQLILQADRSEFSPE